MTEKVVVNREFLRKLPNNGPAVLLVAGGCIKKIIKLK
jgi:hypothetical protein